MLRIAVEVEVVAASDTLIVEPGGVVVVDVEDVVVPLSTTIVDPVTVVVELVVFMKAVPEMLTVEPGIVVDVEGLVASVT